MSTMIKPLFNDIIFNVIVKIMKKNKNIILFSIEI